MAKSHVRLAVSHKRRRRGMFYYHHRKPLACARPSASAADHSPPPTISEFPLVDLSWSFILITFSEQVYRIFYIRADVVKARVTTAPSIALCALLSATISQSKSVFQNMKPPGLSDERSTRFIEMATSGRRHPRLSATDVAEGRMCCCLNTCSIAAPGKSLSIN